MRGQLAWPYFKVELPEKVDFEKGMQSAPVSDAQSEYYLGDMLLHIRRYDAAENELRKAVSLDPAFGGSYASLGMLRLREGKPEEALQFLSKAVEADTRNPMAHFYYAQLLQRLASSDKSENRQDRLRLVRTHLKQAIEIDPGFIESYRWLGFVALSLQDELPETEAALGTALGLAPGNEELRLTLAEVMASNKKEAAARALLSNLKNTTTNEAIRNRATYLIETITAHLESAAAMRDYESRRREVEQAETLAATTETSTPTVRRRTNGTPSEPASTVTIVSTPKENKGPQVEGVLTKIDCAHGMDLRVQVGNLIVQLHTDTPSKINFVSFISRFKDAIACGPVQPGAHVIITYKRTSDPAMLGEPLIVEFRE